MPHNWKDKRGQYDENRAPMSAAPAKDPMPAVSPKFMEWLKRQPIPDISGTTLQTMQPNDALKQMAFNQGVLWLKAKIQAENEKNQRLTQEVSDA